MFEGPDVVECCVCKQDTAEIDENEVDEDNNLVGVPLFQCSSCDAPICSDCWKKCPEDDAGDKVCEECAR
jgi:hypothetical protein